MNTPSFTVAEASTKLGMQPARPRQWIAQGLFKLHSIDAPASTPGATTLLSGRTALKMGLVSHLSAAVPVLEAIRAADVFAHSGSDAAQERSGVTRRPGELFTGEGVIETLAVFRQRNGTDEWEVSIIPMMTDMKVRGCINADMDGEVSGYSLIIVRPLDLAVDTLRRHLDL